MRRAPSLLARLLRRLPTRAVVDGITYAVALCWLALLWQTPDAAYAGLHLLPVLAFKAAWAWPALAAVLAPPLGWWAPWRWVRRLAIVTAAKGAVSWWIGAVQVQVA